MARFVVQQHANSTGTHYDLMLESGEALATWQIPEPPDGPEHTAARIGDHRSTYLTYEGELSGGRGSVRIWDAGTLAITEYTEDHVLFTLDGKQMNGRYALLLEGNAWTLTRMPT